MASRVNAFSRRKRRLDSLEDLYWYSEVVFRPHLVGDGKQGGASPTLSRQRDYFGPANVDGHVFHYGGRALTKIPHDCGYIPIVGLVEI